MNVTLSEKLELFDAMQCARINSEPTSDRDLEVIAAIIEDIKAEHTWTLGDRNRLAILEAAVAFHGFDELPERKLNQFGRSDVHIDLKTADGKVYYNALHENLASEYIEYYYTGWRYPVGDLSE